MKTTRVVSALLAALLLAGPLVSLASAQQPAEADSAVGQAAPPAGPVPAAQPPAADLFQETLRAEQATSRNRGLYDVGAVIVNLVLVPGREFGYGEALSSFARENLTQAINAIAYLLDKPDERPGCYPGTKVPHVERASSPFGTG